MSKKKAQKKIHLYTFKDRTRLRVDKIPLLYDTHVNNLLTIVDTEGDVQRFKTLYIDEKEYDAILKQIGLTGSSTKIDVYNGAELLYHLRSSERREKDMEMLRNAGNIGI